MIRYRPLKCVFSISTILSLLFIYMCGDFHHETLKTRNISPKDEEIKVILFWNSFYDHKYFNMGVGSEGFQDCQSHCFTTTNRTSLFDPQVKVHAVVFHVPQLTISEVKMLKKEKAKMSFYNQDVTPSFVFFSKEPPQGPKTMSCDVRNPIFKGFFDLTISYRHDSDVICPYGTFLDKNTHQPPLEWKRPPISIINGTSSGTALVPLTDRHRDIAWTVSHCRTINRRENYAQALTKLGKLKVDIFGKCGDHKKFPPRAKVTSGYNYLGQQYKFYLSFESSNCLDYITEKFFYAMEHGLLPVALGGLDDQDYQRIAPPHSYIHVDHFESPSQMMEYLVQVSENEDLFNSYFWWRDHYDLNLSPNYCTCEFCRILHEKDYRSSNDYLNIDGYWNKCRRPKH